MERGEKILEKLQEEANGGFGGMKNDQSKSRRGIKVVRGRSEEN
jgi:hypothetical protein